MLHASTPESLPTYKGRRPPRRFAGLHTLQGYVWPLCTASSDEHRPRRRSPKSFLRSLLLFVSALHKSEQCILLNLLPTSQGHDHIEVHATQMTQFSSARCRAYGIITCKLAITNSEFHK